MIKFLKNLFRKYQEKKMIREAEKAITLSTKSSYLKPEGVHLDTTKPLIITDIKIDKKPHGCWVDSDLIRNTSTHREHCPNSSNDDCGGGE